MVVERVGVSVVAFAASASAVVAWKLVGGVWPWQVAAVVVAGRLVFPDQFPYFWRSALLGTIFSAGIRIAVERDACFGIYLALLSSFHFSEFVVTGLTNVANLGTDSFLLNHSKQYWLAAAASWAEYAIEGSVWPALKAFGPLPAAGLAACLAGEALRKAAMFEAGKNFSHVVQETKRAGHTLVTSGVFAYVRHPSYLGWLSWSVGTQMLMANPVCLVAYAAVSWSFFRARIYAEEYTLLHFFGREYAEYQARVPTGLPFISGYSVVGATTS